MRIRPLQFSDLDNIKNFTDRAIGTGYYSLSELQDIYEKSKTESGQMMTLILTDEVQIFGARITYPPGKWVHGKGKGLTAELWPYSLNETAYFQSLFVDPQFTAQGWGKKMSLASIQYLKETGAKGIVCHSWKESPHDSSGKYLRSIGFNKVA